MDRNVILRTIGVIAVLAAAPAGAEFQRGYVSIVGSSTVYPYLKAVGERVAKAKKIQMPLVQASGTNGGIKLFCEGLGAESPDIVATARPMRPKEQEECRSHGVGELLEMKIGYDALVLVQSKKDPPLALTRQETRKALGKWVADRTGKLVLNPYKTWKDVNPSLPATPIEVYGPPPGSGTYDALVDLLAELECKGRPWVPDGKGEATPEMLRKCRSLREDGVYIEGRENDEELAARLGETPGKVAIFDYKLLRDNANHSRAIPIDGVEPNVDTIATKAYAGSRPLFLYVKKANIDGTPGLKDYLAEMASDRAWGEKGYLKPLGLIVMPADERAIYTAEVKALGIAPIASRGGADGGAPSGRGAKRSAGHRAKSHR
ncbi:substrate-binding domain-containing protein [Candidatus Methylocalor cossyra]|uniref:Phosphate ABC transporter, periplasmic phosphate-binding protein PstS (TC 3.A.1.7.1) n=1 Tax=Candidatus Methylocalor cossyra TaxID=3108543 RepID=A0ABP1C532_9GAMM